MTEFNPDNIESRYIYLDDPCDDTNPMGPVWSRMDAGISADGQKSKKASKRQQWSFPAIWWPTAAADDRRRCAAARRVNAGELGQRMVAGGGCCSGFSSSVEKDPRERE